MEVRSRDGFANYIRAAASGSLAPTLADHANARAYYEAQTVAGARTYLVAEDMLTLAEHASKTMPVEPLAEDDLPAPNGFMTFERGLALPDVRGNEVVMSAFAWRRYHFEGNTGIIWTYYSDPSDERDCSYDIPPEYRLRVRLLLLGEDMEFFGRQPAAPDVIADHFKESGCTPEIATETVRYMRTLPMALWAMMRDYAAVDEVAADRPTRRRLAKAGSPVRPNVLVVKLRRPKHEADDHVPGSVEWSRRWIVNGHWRRQWYATLGMHRAKWIAPFVKGPADKPLVVTRKVHHLVR
jgi:hypothetical protein